MKARASVKSVKCIILDEVIHVRAYGIKCYVNIRASWHACHDNNHDVSTYIY